MKIWYARVSSYWQNLSLQLEKLANYECEKIFKEKVSGASTKKRDALENALDFCREWDVLVITKLDRLARSMFDLQRILNRLQRNKVGFVVLDSNIDTTTAAGKFMFNMLWAVAEFEREIINERIKEGVQRAKANGVKFGPPNKMSKEQIEEMKIALQSGAMTRGQACRHYWISDTTCYRLCPASELYPNGDSSD